MPYTLNGYNYTFLMTIKDNLDNIDTAKINFKANDLQHAINQIEKYINTFLNSSGYTWYNKDRVLLTSLSDEEEAFLLDFISCLRKEDIPYCESSLEEKEYLKLEISCVPDQAYLPVYNDVVIEKEFKIGNSYSFEYYIGKTLNSLLNYHCNNFNNFTVFPYSITNEEKELLLHELEVYRKENNEGREQYKRL